MEETTSAELTRLEKIAEEIPSGVSPSQIFFDHKGGEETALYIQNKITIHTKKSLRDIWDKYNLSEKLEALKSNSDVKFRNSDPIKTIKSKWLIKQKDEMESKLLQKRSEVEQLEKELKEKSTKLKSILERIQNFKSKQ